MTDHLRDLPARLTSSEVCALGRWSMRTFQRRRRTGKFLVQPCDRGAELLFPRDDVLRALDIIPHEEPPKVAPEKPRVSVDAIRERRARALRCGPSKGGRDVASPVRGAGKAPAVRLAFDAAATDR